MGKSGHLPPNARTVEECKTEGGIIHRVKEGKEGGREGGKERERCQNGQNKKQ